MTTSLTRSLHGCLALAAALIATDCLAVGTPKAALQAVRMPGADLETFMNVAKSRNTSFQKEMEVLKKEIEEKGDEDALKLGKRLEAVMKSMGIDEKSLTAVVGAISIRSIDTSAEAPKPPKIPGLLALALSTPLKAETIQEAVMKAVAEEGEEIDIKVTAYKGVPMLNVLVDPANLPEGMPAEAEQVLNDLFVGLPADGAVVYFGQGAQVKSAIDRMIAGKSIPRSSGLNSAKTLVPASADSYLIFEMPDAFRKAMDEQAQNAAGNPMAAGPMMALAGLKSAAFSTVTTDKASFALTGDFEAPENAMQIKAALDMMLGMVKMQLMNMGGGKPLAMADSMKTTSEATKASLTFDITPQDIRDIMAIAERAKAGMGGPGGPGGPGAPAAAPGGVPAP